MGSKGSQTTTTQQNQNYTPTGSQYITNALNQGQAAAQLPMNIPQAPVAGFSQDQQSAFNTVNNSQGIAQPYIDQAAQDFSPQGAQNFLNPYASNVMAQLQNVFGQQAQQQQGQLTQAAGGVGADRIAVGQGLLANQQGLAAGQTLSGLYNNAAQQAQSAGYGTAALGSQAQNAALTGAQAQLGTGGLQQQLQQAQLNAPYQQQLAQAAFPYQQAQFGAGIAGALAPALGGTTTGYGQTTSPAPSVLSQILGLGTAGVGAAGSLGAFGSGKGSGTALATGSQIPGAQGPTSVNGAPLNTSGFARGGSANPFAFADGGSPMFGLPSGFNDKPIDVDQEGLIPQEKLPAAQVHMPSLNLNPPAPAAKSGSGDAAAIVGDAVKIAGMFLARGGAANPLANGYADGGAPDDDPFIGQAWPVGPIGGPTDRAKGMEMLRDAMTNKYGVNPDDPVRLDPGADKQWAQGVDKDMARGITATPSQAPAVAAIEAAAPETTGSVKPSLTPPPPTADVGVKEAAAVPEEMASARDDKSSKLAQNPWTALMAAGLGIAGGTSPFAAVNIGQGGLMGVKALEQQQEAAQKQETIDHAAKRLAQEAKFHEDQYTRATPYQQFEMKKPVPMGQTMGPMGLPMTTYGIPDGKGGYTPIQGNAAKDSAGDANNPIKNIAKAIESGHQPPMMTGLGRLAPGVKSELEKDGFDLTNAQLQYDAAHKQVLSLNAPQMVRFVGLAKSVDNTIDEVKQLSEQMKNSGIPLANQAKLAEMMQLEGNSPKGQLAARYIGAVNTLKEEFANLANGGYAPTEPAWKLANEQINGNYGVNQLGASLDEVQRLIRYRVQGIPNIDTLGPGSQNRYVPSGGAQQGHQPAAAPAGASEAAPHVGDRKQFKQGWGVFNGTTWVPAQ